MLIISRLTFFISLFVIFPAYLSRFESDLISTFRPHPVPKNAFFHFSEAPACYILNTHLRQYAS